MHPLFPIFFGAVTLHIGIILLKNAAKRWSSQRKIVKEHGCKAPPRERPWDVFGLTRLWTHTQNVLNHRSIPSAVERYKTYGETFELKMLMKRVIMTCEPRNLKHLQVDAFEDFNTAEGVRDHIFRPLVSDSLISVDGERWKHERVIYRSLLSATKNIFNEKLHEKTFQSLKSCIPIDGTEVELQELIQKFMFDFSAEWLMGQPGQALRGQDAPERKNIIENLGYAVHILAGVAHRFWLMPFIDKPKLERAIGSVHRDVERVVDEALERKNMQGAEKPNAEPQTLLDNMLQLTTDRSILRNTTMTLLIVATDPVVSVLSSAMWLLARHADVYRKVREEVLAIAGEGPPSCEQVRQMKYLRNVFNEVLRLYVPVPSNGKFARRDTWLPTGGGPDGESSVLIRKGDLVIYTPWVSHRRTEVFGEDADDFRPERWDELKVNNLAGYIPFNLGPRACPGQNFALAQGQWIAARLAQTYSSLKTTDSRDWVEQLDGSFNMKNLNGVNVSFTI